MGGCLSSGAGGGLEARIRVLLVETIALRKREGCDTQTSFNRIILKFPALRVSRRCRAGEPLLSAAPSTSAPPIGLTFRLIYHASYLKGIVFALGANSTSSCSRTHARNVSPAARDLWFEGGLSPV